MELEPFDDRGSQRCLIGLHLAPPKDQTEEALRWDTATLHPTPSNMSPMLDEDEEFLRDRSIGLFACSLKTAV